MDILGAFSDGGKAEAYKGTKAVGTQQESRSSDEEHCVYTRSLQKQRNLQEAYHSSTPTIFRNQVESRSARAKNRPRGAPEKQGTENWSTLIPHRGSEGRERKGDLELGVYAYQP